MSRGSSRPEESWSDTSLTSYELNSARSTSYSITDLVYVFTKLGGPLKERRYWTIDICICHSLNPVLSTFTSISRTGIESLSCNLTWQPISYSIPSSCQLPSLSLPFHSVSWAFELYLPTRLSYIGITRSPCILHWEYWLLSPVSCPVISVTL